MQSNVSDLPNHIIARSHFSYSTLLMGQ